MVRHDHALPIGELFRAFHGKWHACERKERARHGACNSAAPLGAGDHEDQEKSAQTERQEQNDCVDPIEESKRGQEAGARLLG